MIRWKITGHISPNLNGLAPETHRFVASLNEEAARLGTGVRFTATANRILAIGGWGRAARSSTLGGWFLRQAIAAGYLEGEEPVLARGNSLHRGAVRRFEKNRGSDRAERAEIKLREYMELAEQPIYRRPHRPSFWNLRIYRPPGPVLVIAVTPALTIFHLRCWQRLKSPAEQRRLEFWGRLYKWSCWSNHRFDQRASAYLQINETSERNTPYRQFDQRPRAYLHPEHAPKPGWKGNKVIYLGPPRDYAKLAADQQAYNERWASYWSYPLDGAVVGIKERMRRQGSLNLDRAIAIRNNMVTNVDHNFSRAEEQVA